MTQGRLLTSRLMRGPRGPWPRAPAQLSARARTAPARTVRTTDRWVPDGAVSWYNWAIQPREPSCLTRHGPGQPRASVVTASDFTDHAVGLIHTTGPKLSWLAGKYAPLVPVLRA